MAKSLYRGQAIQLLAAAARTTSSNSGNLRDTTGNIPASEAITFLLNVTTLAGNSSPVLDVSIDHSPDGGTTWFEAFHFAQVTSSTAARRLNVRTTGIGIAEAGTEASVALTATAALSNNMVLGPDVRVRWEINGVTTGATSNFGVWAIAMPPGTK